MRQTPLKPTSLKTGARNGRWRFICIVRSEYLRLKYGHIVDEYSGETITTLSWGGDPEDGWGHHIDRNRNNCTPANCYITKYKNHQVIHDNNIQVSQEGFEGRSKR